jgi:endonuclease G
MRSISRLALTALAGCVAAALACAAASAASLDECSEHLPFGVPSVAATTNTIAICHKGYAALVDEDRLVPLWVAYHLTGKHTFGCIDRTDDFHPDELLPPDHRAKPSDYDEPQFDQGHQAPAQDFAWNDKEMHDSFSMANMTPQLPGLNRRQWERLEEAVRAWAADRGDLIIYVGPVIKREPRTIGDDHVVVPSAFWKVVIDPTRQEALAFIMPQTEIPKGPLEPFKKTIADVEAASGVKLPLPAGIDPTALAAIWPADLRGWRAKHKAACPHAH